MRARHLTSLMLFLLLPALAPAEGPSDDPLRDHLFPPELVMQNQQALNLSDEQKTFLKGELRSTQQRFTELQWKMADEMERLVALIKQPQVDEQQALAQLDKVLAAEREVKRTQVALLVRIKDHLRPEQQAQLRELRRKSG